MTTYFLDGKVKGEKFPLVVTNQYGMSVWSTAYITHLADPYRSNVLVVEGYPERTEYWITWYCKKPSKVVFFRKPKRGAIICKRCWELKVFYEAHYGPPLQDPNPPF